MVEYCELYGELLVKDRMALTGLLEDYNNIDNDFSVQVVSDPEPAVPEGVVLLRFSGGAEMTALARTQLRDAAQKFSDIVSEPTFLTFVDNDGPAELYVGPEGQEDKTRSLSNYVRITQLMKTLHPEELLKLRKWVTIEVGKLPAEVALGDALKENGG